MVKDWHLSPLQLISVVLLVLRPVFKLDSEVLKLHLGVIKKYPDALSSSVKVEIYEFKTHFLKILLLFAIENISCLNSKYS